MRRRATSRSSKVSYQTLEQRNLLAASFSLSDGQLTLFDFQDTDGVADGSIVFQQTALGQPSILLTDGDWSGTELPGIVETDVFEGTSRLTLNRGGGGITSILAWSPLADSFDVFFGVFDFNGSLEFAQSGGGVNFGSATQEQFTAFSVRGSFTSNAIDTLILDQNNDFGGNVNVSGAQSAAFRDIDQFDATLQTFGNAAVTARNSITLSRLDVGGQLFATSSQEDLTINAVGDLDIAAISAPRGSIEVTSTSDVRIGGALASDEIFIGVDGGGVLSLDGDVTTTSSTSQVSIQNSRPVDQTNGSITTVGLLLLGTEFTLDGDNAVNNLAANVSGNLLFRNSSDLNIGNLIFGFDASDNATMEDGMDGILARADLDLIAGGRLTQTAPIFVEGAANFASIQEIILTNPANNFRGEVAASSSTVELVAGFELETGAITATDNIFLQSGALARGALIIRGDLTTTAADGQILLQGGASSGQGFGTVITTNELLIGGNGVTDIDYTFIRDNRVNNIAADVDERLIFNNSVRLTIADLTYSSSSGKSATISGINTGQLTELSADGINIGAQLVSPTTILESSFGISQANSDSEIRTTNLALIGSGLFLLDARNAAENLSADIDGTLRYDADVGINIANFDRLVNGITTTGDLFLFASNGEILQDIGNGDASVMVGGRTILDAIGDIRLTDPSNVFTGDVSFRNFGNAYLTTSGNLSIETSSVLSGSNISFIGDQITISDDVVANQFMLDASNGVELAEDSTIDVVDLLVSGTGDFDLAGNGLNMIENLAVDVDGDFEISNAIALNIGTLDFTSDSDEVTNVTISGVNVDAGVGGSGNFTATIENSSITQSCGDHR